MTPCYFINLDRSPARRAHMEQEFARLGLSAQRIAAVDGQLLDNADMPPLTPFARDKWQMTKSEIACAMSHRKAWALIAESDAEHGAVFEDDVRLAPGLAQLLAQTDWIPADLECVKLDLSGIHAFHLRLEPIANGQYALSCAISNLGSSGGYIVTRAAARRLFEATALLGGAVDNMMFARSDPGFVGLHFRQLHPAVCAQQCFLPNDRFLSESAKLSTITHSGPYRPRPRLRFGWKKILRELKRPLKPVLRTARDGIRAAYFGLRYRARLIRVRFEGIHR